jgi:putative ABC transport system substrate-binding protein
MAKKSAFFSLFILILSYGVASGAQKAVVIQSIRIKPYEEAIKGFKDVWGSELERFVISETRPDKIRKKIKENEPDLILAVGIDALSIAKYFLNIPVVYIMVLNPQLDTNHKMITGVSMDISLKQKVTIITQALPEIRKVGLLYNPKSPSKYLEEAQELLNKKGIILIAKQTHGPQSVPKALQEMKTQIDAFWMFPDLTIVTPETVEYIMLFSLENKVPIITFSEKYVELGALLSIGIDSYDIGVQTGELAKQLLSDEQITKITSIKARKAITTINLNVAKQLGIKLNKDLIERARLIE